MTLDALATPWGFATTLIVVLGLITIVLIIVRRFKNIKFGPASASTEDASPSAPALIEEQPSPHTQCIHGKDIVILLKEQSAMFNAVRNITDGVMPEQMKIAEGRGIDVRGIMQRKFLKILAAALGGKDAENLVEHCEYRMYRLCLDIVYNELIARLRTLFRENHYADRTESMFREYVLNKTAELNQHATDLLNDLYHGSIITRVMIYDNNQEIKSSIDMIFSDIFWAAREIAIKAATDTRVLRENFDALFDELF